jgi:hypothetical protein
MITDGNVPIRRFIPQEPNLTHSEFQKRRAISILLVLLFAVGPSWPSSNSRGFTSALLLSPENRKQPIKSADCERTELAVRV